MYQKYVKDVLYHVGWCIFFHYPLGCSENCLLPANMFDISGENFFFFFKPFVQQLRLKLDNLHELSFSHGKKLYLLLHN